jgi:hypothetical protein
MATGTGAVMSNNLALYDAAKAALSKAVKVDEVKKIRDEALALKACAKIAKDRELEANAAELRARAERRLGEMIAAQKATVGLNTGAKGVGKKVRDSEKPALPTLDQAGIDKNLAHRARSAAGMSEQDFEDSVELLREQIADDRFRGSQIFYPETPEQEAEQKAEKKAERKPVQRKGREERRKEREAAIAASRARVAEANGDPVAWLEGTVSNAIESVLGNSAAKPERVFAMLRSLISEMEREYKPARATGTVVQTDDERRALNAALDK